MEIEMWEKIFVRRRPIISDRITNIIHEQRL